MTSHRIALQLQRRAVTFSRRWKQLSWLEGAALTGATGILLYHHHQSSNPWRFGASSPVLCEDYYYDDEDDYETGYTEAERFFHSLEYHRALLPDYERRWLHHHNDRPTDRWPRHVPKSSEITALELDLKFCERHAADEKRCRDLKFRIASFYVFRTPDKQLQRKGFKMLKELAEQGHADGMCLYGRCWLIWRFFASTKQAVNLSMIFDDFRLSHPLALFLRNRSEPR